MSKSELRDVAVLIGHNVSGNIVYEETMPLDRYRDGEHAWDSSEGVWQLDIVKLVGKLYGDGGTYFKRLRPLSLQITAIT